jgi:hypothetical protein
VPTNASIIAPKNSISERPAIYQMIHIRIDRDTLYILAFELNLALPFVG